MAVHGNKVNAIREYYVCKANEVIRESRYNLTTQQQKIVLFAISKIRRGDDPNKYYEIPIDELCAVCNLEYDTGGYYYRTIKNDLKKLVYPTWLQFPDKSEWIISWFSDIGIVPLSGKVYVKFHERIRPYLFDLKDRYTQFHLEEVLCFRGKYAIRLFEILRSYFTQDELNTGVVKEIFISVEKIREQLFIEAYPEWKEFNRNVIKKAVDEINLLAEQLQVTYEPVRAGRKVEKIRFLVSSPADVVDRITRYDRLRKRLPKQNKY